jgi:uncharacterized protein YaaN involved in tellurite resistance
MTTIINEPKTITLLDGTTFEIRPLKISLLRQFMKKFDAIAEVADDNDKSMDALLDCVAVALQQFKPELAADTAALEELLDLPTVYKIVEEASGINLSDSSLINNF